MLIRVWNGNERIYDFSIGWWKVGKLSDSCKMMVFLWNLLQLCFSSLSPTSIKGFETFKNFLLTFSWVNKHRPRDLVGILPQKEAGFPYSSSAKGPVGHRKNTSSPILLKLNAWVSSLHKILKKIYKTRSKGPQDLDIEHFEGQGRIRLKIHHFLF